MVTPTAATKNDNGKRTNDSQRRQSFKKRKIMVPKAILPEKKFFDTNQANVSSTVSGANGLFIQSLFFSPTDPNGISQGNNSITRVGSKIRVVSAHVRGSIISGASNPGDLFRATLLLDKAYDRTAYVQSALKYSISGPPSILEFYNPSNFPDRFRVLDTTMVTLNVGSSSSTPVQYWQLNWKGEVDVNYNVVGSSGVSANLNQVNIFCFLESMFTEATVPLNGIVSRVRFYDA